MAAGTSGNTPEHLSERVAALETLLTELLPLLIQDGPYESEVLQTLAEWQTDPPSGMRGNPAFGEAVARLMDHLPSA